MGRWTAAEFFHDGGYGFAVFADFDTAERAVANFERVALVAFPAFLFARPCIANEELRSRAVAFPVFWLTHEIAIIQTCGFDDHNAGQGGGLAESFSV